MDKHVDCVPRTQVQRLERKLALVKEDQAERVRDLRHKVSLSMGGFFDYAWHHEDCPNFEEDGEKCLCGFEAVYQSLTVGGEDNKDHWYTAIKKLLIRFSEMEAKA